MTDLAALLERVEKATGPDRALDASIHVLMCPDDLASKIMTGRMEVGSWTLGVGGIAWESKSMSGSSGCWPVPRYTASIDAGVALVEKVLRGWQHAGGCFWGVEDMPWACLTEPEKPFRDFAADGPTIPLAICAAILRALIQKDPHHD